MSDRIDTDAVLHRAMLANQLEDPKEPVNLAGDLYRTTVAKQREDCDILNMFHGVGVEVRNELVVHKLLGTAAHALGWIGSGIIAAGKETILRAIETMHEGDELKEAVKREYAAAACAMLCADALPLGFTTQLYGEFVKPGAASPGAVAVYKTILSRPDAADIQQGFVDNCRDAQRYALDRHIGTAADRTIALQQNPYLAKRYQHDLAFKLGIDSVVWASEHGQLPAIEQQLPAAPAATALEVRG